MGLRFGEILMITLKNYAIVFPGQGSQKPQMLADIAARYSQVKETFDQASKALGYDLWNIVQENPEDKLNQTEFTQPALLTASVALWKILNDRVPLSPNYLAGHSLGEYSALVCGESIDFDTAVKLVNFRGQFMQDAVPVGVGAMAAIIGLEADVVAQLCQEVANSEVLTPANFNAIGQTVVAGHDAAIERLIIVAKEKGAKIAKRIPISVPSHCALMTPAAKKFATKLSEASIHATKIPVIHNVDVKIHSDHHSISLALTTQLDHPVRWVETIQWMAKNGIETVIECGPGKVLAGLIKRINPDLTTLTMDSIDDIENVMEKLS